MKIKRITILGSTGSIGTSTLRVIRDFPEYFKVVGLSTYSNIELLKKQIEEFSPKWIYIANEEKRKEIKFKNSINSEDGLIEIIEKTSPDIVVIATVGFTGLKPTIYAIENNITVALANKEVLVVAGDIIKEKQKKYKTPIYPIDSEHSAIFQCLHGNKKYLSKIILTSSGGPFRTKSIEEIKRATYEEVLNHPTWNMGKKITVDSATMINKGFEVIEAHYLFDIEPENIEVLIHPQSIIHSMIELIDNTIIAQLSPTDMYYPILYALSYPKRLRVKHKTLNLAEISKLTFEKPDYKKFPCLKMAYEVLKLKKGYSVVFNAANEIAVNYFLNQKLQFYKIPIVIEKVLSNFTPPKSIDLKTIFQIDKKARQKTIEVIEKCLQHSTLLLFSGYV